MVAFADGVGAARVAVHGVREVRIVLADGGTRRAAEAGEGVVAGLEAELRRDDAGVAFGCLRLVVGRKRQPGRRALDESGEASLTGVTDLSTTRTKHQHQLEHSQSGFGCSSQP